MIQIVIIGIGAGAAAALLFASVTSGSWLSIPLFYLAPLPIMIAGLGWSHWAAMTAALAGALGLGAVFGTVFLLAFAAGAGFPAWWLGYLAMLARPVAATNGSGQGAASFEWYPPGRLVVWAAVLGVLVVIVAIPNFGIDADSFRAGLRDALNAIMRVNSGTPARAGSNTERLLEILVNAIPPAAAVLATITNLLNLWLAARIVKFSGRLARPWPQLSSMSFPPLMAAALAVAIVLSFLDGMLGIVGGIVAASLLLAYGVLGFAVLHAITQGMSARPFVLSITYAGVILLGWPMLALCLLGLVDTAIGLRGRVSAKRGPPTRS
ncbi:MAG: DUF2232 domain-containing protein [Pseudolabrys sp.]|jgi:Predicted membrane protein (DUF2232)